MEQVIPVVVTSLNEDGRIYFNPPERHINYLVTNGVYRLLLTGSTGEDPLLNKQEKTFSVKQKDVY